MLPTQQGSMRLVRIFGIQVYLHWTWFLVALIEINSRSRAYSSFLWNVLEYLALFAIVLLHEFGHALACRQVGGKADQIVLWPLGGVAYVSPPQRPGATLWSIAAGPLVNAVLAPILIVLWLLAREFAAMGGSMSLCLFLENLCVINLALLAFNLLPVFPLDGGQILRSLLWYVTGRARSLMISAAVGFLGVVALAAVAIRMHDFWLGILSVFVGLNCWRGFVYARMLARLAKLRRRDGFACPACGQAPVLGPAWRCAKCLQPFDTFETRAVCPHCGSAFGQTQCFDCGGSFSISAWSALPLPPPPPPPPPLLSR